MNNSKRQKIWEEMYTVGDSERDAAVSKMAKSLGVSPLFAVLLYNRGYKTAEGAARFLRFEETNFHDPFLMADMDRAVDRILKAVDGGEKIYIYGDYDVDGVTSVSMLYLYLSSLGCDVNIKIPKRDGEGYGVSAAAVKTIAESGASLVITVDTGITAADEVAYAAQLGVDFVITDHHECHGELPAAVAVVNPHRPDCTYPFCELAGVGVIFKVMCACEMIRAERYGEPRIVGARRICSEYADLVSVGTIADVMPLIDENRLIVSLGLAKLSRGEGRPGLIALLDASSKRGDDEKNKKVTSGMIGFGIAPRINAAGRISDALIAVKLLLASDEETVAFYTEQLCEINKQRQTEENSIATQAYRMIEDDPSYASDKVIILDCDDWQQGIIGIVSSRITEKYGLPSILISFKGAIIGEPHAMDDGKGSGRSIKGLNLVEALGHCEDLLVKYGGHELAAGLTVKRGQIEDFRKRINQYAEEHMTEDMLKIREQADCELEAKDITLSFADEILSLEPFGIGNPTPQFVMHDVTIKKISSISGGKHAKLQLTKNGTVVTALYFRVGDEFSEFSEGEQIDVLFKVDVNSYRGSRSVQLVIQDMRMSQRLVDRFDAEKNRYVQICDGAGYDHKENILPDRDDFARVYMVLRKEFRNGIQIIKTRSMLRLINDGNQGIGYIKLKFVLRILNELQICSVEEIEEDLYKIDIYFNASKTSIDKSSILKRLKGQCIKC